jgi:Zn finger protein HypA/HybF involved in hydrogenase expression
VNKPMRQFEIDELARVKLEIAAEIEASVNKPVVTKPSPAHCEHHAEYLTMWRLGDTEICPMCGCFKAQFIESVELYVRRANVDQEG